MVGLAQVFADEGRPVASARAVGVRGSYTFITLHLKVEPSLLAARQFRVALLDGTN